MSELKQGIIYTRQSHPHVSQEIEQSLLRGSITCGYCGRSLMVFGSDYRCSAKSNKTCCGVAIAIDTIDTAVWDEVTTQLGDHRIALYISDELASEQKRQLLKHLGVTVILFAENDTAHNRYEIKQSSTTL